MRRRGFTLVELLTVCFILAVLAAIMVPAIRRAITKAQYVGCISNLESISRVAQIYANDNGDNFPATLGTLVPNYISLIPTCPAAGTDTYTPGYQPNAALNDYTVVCHGQNHSDLGLIVDEPFFSPESGVGPPLF